MNYNKQTVKDVPLSGKKVLLRCDFNVPQDKTTGEITSDKRIVAALPTIRYLLDHGAAVIACSHLGKPKGTWKESLTLAPVAIANGPTPPNAAEIQHAQDVLVMCAKERSRLLDGYNLMCYMLQNPACFVFGPPGAQAGYRPGTSLRGVVSARLIAPPGRAMWIAATLPVRCE